MSTLTDSPEVPLAEKMRPRKLEDIVGQRHLLGRGNFLPRALESGRMFSVIFWGPPGSGKTTLARLMSECTRLPFYSFSAVTSGIKELRQIIEKAKTAKASTGKPTILFVDEIHRFNKAQQDAFLPHVESGLIILIGATTQNPSFEVIPPLLSRARVMVLNSLGHEELKTLIHRALRDKELGFGLLDIEFTSDAIEHLVDCSQGDARVALNNLEATVYYVMDGQGNGSIQVALDDVEKTLNKKALIYDKDGEEHYNLISAFHKSLRGSDEQASIYWLYRMLMAGEDPLFIGRRMIRFAAEDVGLADPNALQVALAAFESWQRVGPPEAEVILAEAAAYLASAPKSNALYLAEKSVKEEIRRSGSQPVPHHIRNAPTSLMKKMGYGQGYRYPHNYSSGWVKQGYFPQKVRNRVFYRPTNRGFEREVRKRIDGRRESHSRTAP
jgi:putative ATPase